jgi:hypothetical protein
MSLRLAEPIGFEGRRDYAVKKALGVETEAEAVRLSVERVAEMKKYWAFMKKSRRSPNLEAWRNPEVDCTHCTTPWSPLIGRISSCFDWNSAK